jgi:hypothetical protein
MAAPPLTSNSVLLCPHGGLAQPVTPTARIRIDGATVVSAATIYRIVGCTLPPSEGGPCLSAAFVAGPDRVRANGAALLSAGSTAVCLPTGAPLLIDAAQTRVSGG